MDDKNRSAALQRTGTGTCYEGAMVAMGAMGVGLGDVTVRMYADLCGCVGASPGRQQLQPLDSSDNFQTESAGIWGCTRKATATMPTFRTRRAGMDCPEGIGSFYMFLPCFTVLHVFLICLHFDLLIRCCIA